MASSKMELSPSIHNKKNVQMDIDWYGLDNGGETVSHQASNALNLIDNALIIVHFTPSTGSTCLRMILHLFRKAESLGKEVRVVLPDKEQFNAAKITGLTNSYRIFLTEIEALKTLNIRDFYPLELISLTEIDPDPIAA